MADAHSESGLGKATWSHRDFEALSWDLCQIHAIAVTGDEGPPDDLAPEELLERDDVDDDAPPAEELHLDIDYIVRRVQGSPWEGVRFWVSPATLVFHDVWSIGGELRGVWKPMTMTNLIRSEPRYRYESPGWTLVGEGLELRFAASGFTLHLRRPPRYGNRVLRMAERGGLSFEPRSFA
ncbi:MAG TPA: hypothetical protein VFN97_16320 [Actinospica sp.]|nr:hypothetical protein [Actinospica sp.]